MNPLRDRAESAYVELERALMAERGDVGWKGELSTSALSTATASLACWLAATADTESGAGLERSRRDSLANLARRGCAWLAAHSNADEGWGDTTKSASNISTTTLAWAVLGAVGSNPNSSTSTSDTVGVESDLRRARLGAERWLRARVGSLDPAELARAITSVYGDDRTFSVPILTHAALSGAFGSGPDAWRQVQPLPFELAALPASWYRFVGLPVVSYALPALIAIGIARFSSSPPRHRVQRFLRSSVKQRALRVLDAIQPTNGGFLEATPLTSFVVMSLIGSGLASHPVVERGLAFLRESVRPEGCWPIDTNLSTWVTTLAIHALSSRHGSLETIAAAEKSRMRNALLDQQTKERHPYTGAAPGAWAWTDLPGGVPDADDTPGTLLALRYLGVDDRSAAAAARGVTWLLDLQNADGGMPTFCRGWGKLPFDRSGADLTAHAVRAWLAWRDDLTTGGRWFSRRRIDRGLDAAVRFLARSQRGDGSWVPLWFGNEAEPRLENPTYGTSRVLVALGELERQGFDRVRELRERGVEWILGSQRPCGGWGGGPELAASVEETGLALEALGESELVGRHPRLIDALERGVVWLCDAIEAKRHLEPTPIGFFFARLWYFERLYPLVFGLAGLGRALRAMDARNAVDPPRIGHEVHGGA
jgi:squalene-hopene/tetraprenyl-beta-curcumene cyclase